MRHLLATMLLFCIALPWAEAQKQNYMWVDSEANYRWTSNPDSIRYYVRKCRDAGFRNLVVDVKNIMGETLYPSDIAPFMGNFRGVERTRDYDMLSEFLEIGHANGVKIFASMNVFSGGHKHLRHGIVYDGDKQSWQSIYYTPSGFIPSGDDPATVEAMLNPADMDVQRYELDIIDELARKYPDLDGLILDRMRFNDIDADFSDLSRRLYEAHVGHEVANFPQDMIEWYKLADGSDAWKKGPEFSSWIEWRAGIIHDFIAEVRKEVKAINPDLKIGTYTGSWYPLYYCEGLNWASRRYDPSHYLDWASETYRNTAYADLLDVYMSGLYYSTVTKAQVDENLRRHETDPSWPVECATTPERMRFARDHWFCVEGGAQWVRYITAGEVPVIGTLYVDMFFSDMTEFPRAIKAARDNTDGLTVFDISAVIRKNAWESFSGIK